VPGSSPVESDTSARVIRPAADEQARGSRVSKPEASTEQPTDWPTLTGVSSSADLADKKDKSPLLTGHVVHERFREKARLASKQLDAAVEQVRPLGEHERTPVGSKERLTADQTFMGIPVDASPIDNVELAASPIDNEELVTSNSFREAQLEISSMASLDEGEHVQGESSGDQERARVADAKQAPKAAVKPKVQAVVTAKTEEPPKVIASSPLTAGAAHVEMRVAAKGETEQRVLKTPTMVTRVAPAVVAKAGVVQKPVYPVMPARVSLASPAASPRVTSEVISLRSPVQVVQPQNVIRV